MKDINVALEVEEFQYVASLLVKDEECKFRVTFTNKTNLVTIHPEESETEKKFIESLMKSPDILVFEKGMSVDKIAGYKAVIYHDVDIFNKRSYVFSKNFTTLFILVVNSEATLLGHPDIKFYEVSENNFICNLTNN